MEEGGNIWRSPGGGSTSSPSPLGRVMSTLLGSRPRQLEAALSRIGPAPSRSTSGAHLDESLCFLWRHVKDAVRKGEPLDQVLVPMIEHSLKFKGPKQSRQVLILISWLFEDEDIFQSLSSNLAAIIVEKEDHYIAFGWCTLVSGLVDSTLNKFSDKGKQEKQLTLLKILCQSVSRLLSIICKGSTLQDEYELPTRLSVAAADCTLFLTKALTEAASLSKRLSSSTSESHLFSLKTSSNSMKEYGFSQKHSEGLKDMEMECLLWDQLDLLITLVQRLQAWSRKSRSLHSKGLAQVLKWMQEIKLHYSCHSDEAGGKLLKGGIMLLCSSWKHYAMLMLLEDHRFSQHYGKMLEQYMSAIQLYMQDESDDGPTNTSIETRKFFLNCLSLLLGRLDGKQLETVIGEHGRQLVNILFSQLQYDDDLVEGSLNILRAVIFTARFTSGSPLDTDQMDAVLPILLKILDERGPTTKAVVLLVAEYCSIYPNGQGLQEILRRLKYGNHYQKKYAIDVISELVRICSDSGSETEHILSSSLRQDIAKQFIECLGDEELTSHVQESNLLPHFADPHSVLPELVRLVYSGNEKVSFSASDAIVDFLRWHNQNFSVVLTLIDCLSNLSGNPDANNKAGGVGENIHGSPMFFDKGQKLDVDRVLGLTPRWSQCVQNWSLLIEQIISKMFQDPSNAIVVRFMGYISEHLADAGDLVLYRVLSHMLGQNEMDESWLYDHAGKISNSSFAGFKDSLFDHLCPLLLLRVLPLRVFDDLQSSTLYGNLCEILKVNRDYCINNQDCVAVLLFNRAFSMFEFEDVRKLAAELCGRLHPEVLLPVTESQLKHATQCRDTMKMKACLFAICTSLMARDRESVLHPVMPRIRKILEMVLFWPSLDADEVSKAQHGCIDCLALMICAELKSPGSLKDFSRNRVSIVGEAKSSGDSASTSSTLTYIIQRLTRDENCDGLSGLDEAICYRHSYSDDKSLDTSPSISEVMSNVPTSIRFRLCMANVLISACQKVSSSRKDLFACGVLPPLICSVEAITCSDVRAACLQIFFSAVYHLKSSVLPFSSDLLSLSVKALKKGSEKEKLAAAKLMASLMASEDEIIDNISGGLLEAKSVLEKVASKESSSELQQLCKQLLVCVSSPLDVCL